MHLTYSLGIFRFVAKEKEKKKRKYSNKKIDIEKFVKQTFTIRKN